MTRKNKIIKALMGFAIIVASLSPISAYAERCIYVMGATNSGPNEWIEPVESNRAIDTKNKMVSNTPDDLRLIDKYFPEVRDMLPAIRECEEVRFNEQAISILLDKKEHPLNRGSLYDPIQKQTVDLSNTVLQIKRDPSDGNKFHLFVNSLRVFQWIKQKWESLKQTVKRGFGHKF